jgi:hypothetical protein
LTSAFTPGSAFVRSLFCIAGAAQKFIAAVAVCALNAVAARAAIIAGTRHVLFTIRTCRAMQNSLIGFVRVRWYLVLRESGKTVRLRGKPRG